MGRIRQKIKAGNYEVVIINLEAQGKVIATIIDKSGKLLGQLRIGAETGWYENGKVELPFNLN